MYSGRLNIWNRRACSSKVTLLDESTGGLYDGILKEEYIENLKKAILECIKNSDEVVKRGTNARKKVELYTWKKKNNKYQEIYMSLLK